MTLATGIVTEVRDGILRIAFDRREKKNAITAVMYQTLADTLKAADHDPAVRVILIHGQEDLFTAGNDLEDFLRHPPSGMDSPVMQFLVQLNQTEKPLVAAVCGVAVGVGTTLLLHCDLVYAADNARFSMPFTQLGLCPEAASSLLLPLIVGYQRAAEKLLLGEAFGAIEAKEMGFVNQVLPAAEVLAHAQQQAEKLAALPASSIRATKRLMKAGQSAAAQQRIADEASEFMKMLTAPEAKEAFTAFMQKRKPDFRQFS